MRKRKSGYLVVINAYTLPISSLSFNKIMKDIKTHAIWDTIELNIDRVCGIIDDHETYQKLYQKRTLG